MTISRSPISLAAGRPLHAGREPRTIPPPGASLGASKARKRDRVYTPSVGIRTSATLAPRHAGAWSAASRLAQTHSLSLRSFTRRRRGQSRAAAGAEGFAEFLRQETTGGQLLLVATALALLWANVSESSYRAVWDAGTAVGPAWLHLDLTLGDWAADGLLAIFLFVAGLELKRELIVGELADRGAAALCRRRRDDRPRPCRLGGVWGRGRRRRGLGDPDCHRHRVRARRSRPRGLGAALRRARPAAVPGGYRRSAGNRPHRHHLHRRLSTAWLAGGLAVSALYWLAFRHRLDRAWLLWALAVVAWICVHASGVHATVAGILLGLLTPVRSRPGDKHPAGERLEHRLHPISAGIAVPVFALAAAGISLGAVADAVNDKIAVGVFAGLLVGRSSAFLVARSSRSGSALGASRTECNGGMWFPLRSSARLATPSASFSHGWRSPTSRRRSASRRRSSGHRYSHQSSRWSCCAAGPAQPEDRSSGCAPAMKGAPGGPEQRPGWGWTGAMSQGSEARWSATPGRSLRLSA